MIKTLFLLPFLGIALLAPEIAHADDAADAARGQSLFRNRCGACHSVEPGQNRVGPSLAGVIGRKAGSVDGARYSDALKNSDIVWDAANIASFIGSPRDLVPGTRMTVSIRDERDRADISAYLQSLSAP